VKFNGIDILSSSNSSEFPLLVAVGGLSNESVLVSASSLSGKEGLSVGLSEGADGVASDEVDVGELIKFPGSDSEPLVVVVVGAPEVDSVPDVSG